MATVNSPSNNSDWGWLLLAVCVSVGMAWTLALLNQSPCLPQTKAITVTQLVVEHEVNANVADTFRYYVGTAEAVYETQRDIYARLQTAHTYTATVTCDNRLVAVVRSP